MICLIFPMAGGFPGFDLYEKRLEEENGVARPRGIMLGIPSRDTDGYGGTIMEVIDGISTCIYIYICV